MDRFLYGSENIEAFDDIHIHSHTSSSITMAGEPIGYLENTAPYENMEQLNEVQVQTLSNQYNNKSIYSIYLQSKSKPFHFKGYE